MKRFTLAQVLILVALLFGVVTIVPHLLDASSDISIMIGVLIVVSLFFFVVKYGRKIAKWIGFDFDEDN